MAALIAHQSRAKPQICDHLQDKLLGNIRGWASQTVPLLKLAMRAKYGMPKIDSGDCIDVCTSDGFAEPTNATGL
jgi:hypothetical protein